MKRLTDSPLLDPQPMTPEEIADLVERTRLSPKHARGPGKASAHGIPYAARRAALRVILAGEDLKNACYNEGLSTNSLGHVGRWVRIARKGGM